MVLARPAEIEPATFGSEEQTTGKLAYITPHCQHSGTMKIFFFF
jgi:hypothetical protein